ncbi:MAG: hypothetical protein JWO41_255 [Candidatus Saccharibacteria bacterium]|nr:hypothetical protein [Candidatus Saccharibacteria bacterium]
MARIIGLMAPDNKDQFAPLAEYLKEDVDEFYGLVGDQLMKDLTEKPKTMERSGAFLIEVDTKDRRIVCFPFRIAEVVSVNEA